MTSSDREVQRRKAEELRRLHHDELILTLVNVWDAASARVVAGSGSSAVATASAAIGDAHGYEDGEQIPLDLAIAALERICRAVELPVTADLERGYGDVPATVAAALDAGAVGLNLEDALVPVQTMVQRIDEAVDVGREHGVPLVLNARTDVYLLQPNWPSARQHDEARSRGRSYLAAGADCVFVPGLTDEQQIRDLAASFGPGRLNLLAVPGLAAAGSLQKWGVARVSHGPFPHRHAMSALDSYARRHLTRERSDGC